MGHIALITMKILADSILQNNLNPLLWVSFHNLINLFNKTRYFGEKETQLYISTSNSFCKMNTGFMNLLI